MTTPLNRPLLARWLAPVVALLLVVGLVGCDSAVDSLDNPITFTFTFETSAENWTGDFADYPTDPTNRPDMELEFERRALPSEIDGNRMGLFLAGRNTSDDLFMFLKREVTGLEPNTTYDILFEITLASNAASGCAGIGGAPGESVYLKAGAARVEPVPVPRDGDYRLNVDKSNQSQGGANAMVIGHIANGTDNCTGPSPYVLIDRDNDGEPFTISTDADGTLWLLVGTDSGFEGKTALYYDTIQVTLEAQ